MDLRAVTGYIALALLAGYWIWVLSCTTPELRKGTRDRTLRLRILLVKTAAVALTALVVGTVHFWATEVWHVLVVVPLAFAAGYLLRRAYRRLVAAPRHRLPLAQRVRRAGHLHVITQAGGRQPAHRVDGVAVPAPRRTPESVLPTAPVPPLVPVESAAPPESVLPTAPVRTFVPAESAAPPEQANAT